MNTMTNSMTIKDLFDRRNIYFIVPEYQRAYAWGEKQFSQFIEDLNSCSGIYYYLGHFLFEQYEGKFYIIDGQQRMTTCVILFSVIANTLRYRQEEWIQQEDADEINELIEDIQDRYLYDMRHSRQRLIPVSYDNNFFVDAIIEYKKDILSEELTSKSQKAMLEARMFFEKESSKASIQQMLNWVYRIENASITTFIVEDKLQATQIFAYQNDRGKRLTNLEILKAYFMLQIFNLGTHEYDIVYMEKAFEEIYRHVVLVTVEEDNALNYYWRAVGPKGYHSENVISEVKEWLKMFPQDEQVVQIKNFVKGLSKAFCLIKQIEQDDSFYTMNLKYMNNMAFAYPVLIKARLLNVNDEVFARLIKLLENLTFRFLIRGGRADIKYRLQSVLQDANDTEGFDKLIDSVKWKLNNDWWWRYWSDTEMLNHIRSGWFYGNRVDNYLLWRYEQYLCNDDYPNPKVSYTDVISNESIEHIAPQSQENPLENGYGIYDNKENPNEGIVSGGWMNSIGNLLLIAGRQNSSLGNRPFAEKLQVYGKDNLLNQQKEILEFVTDKEYPTWDKSSIERRFNKIINAAKEIWNLDNI